MTEHIPHPANVPGDFYVVDGCCSMCEAVFGEAPELIGSDEDPNRYPHCYVKKQPENAVELEHMINAIEVADLRCIRYRGTDRRIQLQLINVKEGIVCDNLPVDLQKRAERVPTKPCWKFWG